MALRFPEFCNECIKSLASDLDREHAYYRLRLREQKTGFGSQQKVAEAELLLRGVSSNIEYAKKQKKLIEALLFVVQKDIHILSSGAKIEYSRACPHCAFEMRYRKTLSHLSEVSISKMLSNLSLDNEVLFEARYNCPCGTQTPIKDDEWYITSIKLEDLSLPRFKSYVDIGKIADHYRDCKGGLTVN